MVTMEFKYTKVKNSNPRPILKVEMTSLEGSFIEYPYMLVDSGADITVINMELTPLLGVDLKKCAVSEITGVGGSKLKAYQTRLRIKIKDRITTSDIVFAKLTEKGYGMLGQKGFFEFYTVVFNGGKEKFSVESPFFVQ